MTNLELLTQAHQWTATRIADIRPHDLNAPTPCPPWNLRQLAGHLVEMLTVIAEAAEGHPITAARYERALTAPAREHDPVTSYSDLTARLRDAWQAPGAMDRTYSLSFGPVPAHTLAGVNLLEVVVHGWDIARATGHPVDIPSHLALAVHDIARGPVVARKRGTAFGAPVDAPDTDSNSDQLVAFLGRNPRWTQT